MEFDFQMMAAHKKDLYSKRNSLSFINIISMTWI